MSVIKQISVGGVTHSLIDGVSGYGSFDVTQGITPGVSGATPVITIQSRAMQRSDFGAWSTTTLYSTSGSSSGNNWTASVSGTNLIINSTGSTTPVSQTLMPDMSQYSTRWEILDSLVELGILRKFDVVSSSTGEVTERTYNLVSSSGITSVSIQFAIGTTARPMTNTLLINANNSVTHTITALEMTDLDSYTTQTPSSGVDLNGYAGGVILVTSSYYSSGGGGGVVDA